MKSIIKEIYAEEEIFQYPVIILNILVIPIQNSQI